MCVVALAYGAHSLTPPFKTAQRNVQRADHALSSDIPKLRDDLEDSLVILQNLSTTLPRIRSRVANIRHAYDSGRTKVSRFRYALIEDWMCF